MGTAIAIAIIFALVAVFVKAVQMSVGGMPAWQAAHHIPASKIRPVLR